MNQEAFAAMREGVAEVRKAVEAVEHFGVKMVALRAESARAALRYVEHLESVGAGNLTAQQPTAWMVRRQSDGHIFGTYPSEADAVAVRGWSEDCKVIPLVPVASSSPAERQEAEEQKGALRDLIHIGAYLDKSGAPDTLINRLASVCEFIAAPASAAPVQMQSLADAVDREFPIPDNPHQSVIEYAHANRAAFARGWNSARLAAPSSPSVSGTVDTAEFRDLLSRVWNSPSIGLRDERAKFLIAHIDQHTAQAVIAAREEAAQWISVDERLPGEQGQDSEEVLCFLSGHCTLTDMECRQGGGWGIRLGYYDAEKGMFRTHGRPDPSVTHWMPLPATPQAEAGTEQEKK